MIRAAKHLIYMLFWIAPLLSITVITWFAWIWSPLPDSRIEWRPYFDQALEENDCMAAFNIAYNAYFTYGPGIVEVAQDYLAAPDCINADIGIGKRTDLSEGLSADFIRSLRKSPKFDGLFHWQPGWRGRLATWRYGLWYHWELMKLQGSRIKSPRDFFAWPFSVGENMRCIYVSEIYPAGAYYALRTIISDVHKQPDLRIPQWEARQIACTGRTPSFPVGWDPRNEGVETD